MARRAVCCSLLQIRKTALYAFGNLIWPTPGQSEGKKKSDDGSSNPAGKSTSSPDTRKNIRVLGAPNGRACATSACEICRLAVRIDGEVAPERVEIFQEADDIVVHEIKTAGLYRQIRQLFTVPFSVRSVRVMSATSAPRPTPAASARSPPRMA